MIPYLLDDLKRDEGVRLSSYQDTKGVWTVGFGCTGPDIGAATCWTKAQAEDDLAKRCQQLEGQLDHAIPWWRGLNAVRQAVLANMAFNLGVHGLLGFHQTLAACQAQDFKGAAVAMLWNGPAKPTQWAIDVGRRATRLALQMETGERPRPPQLSVVA